MMKSIPLLLPLLVPTFVIVSATNYQQICAIDPKIERFFPVGRTVDEEHVMATRQADIPGDSSSTASTKVPLYRCICHVPSFHDSRTTQSYCPKGNACGIPFGNGAVQCFEPEVMEGIARTAWPIFMATSFFLLLVMVTSFYGLALVKFIRKLCLSNEDRATLENAEVEELWQIDRQPVGAPSWIQVFSFQRYQYQSTILKHARIRWQQEWKKIKLTAPPPTLCLPTKRYVAAPTTSSLDETNNYQDSSDAYEVSCSICFAELEDGNKIGDLSCRHEFHVDCLKTWLVRRNTCPLCQAPNIACSRSDRYRTTTTQLPVTILHRPDEELQLLDGDDVA